MVRTLMKHEYLRTRALIGVVFGAGTLFTLVGTAMTLLRLPVLSTLGVSIGMFGVAAMLPAVQLALGVDYWRNAYRRGGYLTQTLPVRGSTQYWVRLAWGIVVSLVGALVTLVLGVVLALGIASARGVDARELWLQARDAWDAVAAALPAWGWLAAPIVLLVLLASNLVQYYFAVSVGSERRLNSLGVGGPLLAWVGTYLFFQVLMFAGLLAIPLGLTAVGGSVALAPNNVLEAMRGGPSADAMPIGWLPALVVGLALLVWRTRLSWERKVALT